MYSEYERASGAKFNRGKPKRLWMDAWKYRLDIRHRVGKKIPLLGAYCRDDTYSVASWKSLVAKFEKRLAA